MLEMKVLSVIIVILLINCAIILTNWSGGAAVQTGRPVHCDHAVMQQTRLALILILQCYTV